MEARPNYAQRIVGLVASGRRCGMDFDTAWARAIEVAGTKGTWHRPRAVQLTLDDRAELSPLEFLRERCRVEWDAEPGGPILTLDMLLGELDSPAPRGRGYDSSRMAA